MAKALMIQKKGLLRRSEILIGFRKDTDIVSTAEIAGLTSRTITRCLVTQRRLKRWKQCRDTTQDIRNVVEVGKRALNPVGTGATITAVNKKPSSTMITAVKVSVWIGPTMITAVLLRR
jgi:hypothetical protein